MIKILPVSHLERKLFGEDTHFPFIGQLELTYRCQFDCVHCYCKSSADKARELTTGRWKKILDELQKAGCRWIGFTGGDPFIRTDFPQIYSYAKKKGFIVTILTNGVSMGAPILNLDRVFIDTSRAKRCYTDSIALASALAHQGK